MFRHRFLACVFRFFFSSVRSSRLLRSPVGFPILGSSVFSFAVLPGSTHALADASLSGFLSLPYRVVFTVVCALLPVLLFVASAAFFSSSLSLPLKSASGCPVLRHGLHPVFMRAARKVGNRLLFYPPPPFLSEGGKKAVQGRRYSSSRRFRIANNRCDFRRYSATTSSSILSCR